MLNRVESLVKLNVNDIVCDRSTEETRVKTLDIFNSVSQQVRVPLLSILISQAWEDLINKIWIEI